MASTATALMAVGLIASTLVGNAVAHEAHGHPAKLHEGTCDALGRVASSLTGVGAEIDLAGTPVVAGEAVNSDRAYQVMRSETTLETSLDDLLAAPHALDGLRERRGSFGHLLRQPRWQPPRRRAGGWSGRDRRAGSRRHRLFEETDGSTTVRIFLGRGLAPVSASRSADGAGHEAAEADAGRQLEAGDDHDDGVGGVATPDAGA
jgi:hypothetical protein